MNVSTKDALRRVRAYQSFLVIIHLKTRETVFHNL